MAEMVAEAEMPTQSPGAVEISTAVSGELAEMTTAVTEMTSGEALASSLFFQHHQFMCSECGSLYNTLEEVLSHQEQHLLTMSEEETLTTQDTGLESELVVPSTGAGPFQCGECSQLILSPSELLAHQDAHLQESASRIQYQCGDCRELFPSPELWVAHRKTQHLSSAADEPPPPLPPPNPPPPPPEVKMEPYECPECSTLCATPEEFLEHQGTHFDSLEKEERNGLEEEGEDEEEEGEEEDDDDEETDEEETSTELTADDTEGDRSTADPARSCGDCSQHCTSSGARRKHRRASNGPAPATHPFHCSQCQRSFSSANRLVAHGRAHVGGTYECSTCSKVFKKAASLEQHQRLHRGEARYLCVDCGRGFGTELTLVAHRRAHTANPLHRCRCGKTFSNMTKFLYHRRTHTGKSGTPTKVATVSPAPAEPTPMPPPPPAQLPCPQCPKSFASASRLSRHRRAVHGPPERRHRCGVCGKGFKKLVHVRNHLRTHTGERPFQCHSCGKTFASLANLSRHQLTHTGVRPYQCLDCGKRFTQSSNLQQHRRLHLRPVAFARAPRLPITGLYNKSPYYCGTCGRWFRAMAGLRLHQRVHARARSLTLQPPRSPSPVPPPAPEPQQTIMCTELGETIAIIETSQPLALEDTLQLCQAALGASEASGLLQLDTAFV